MRLIKTGLNARASWHHTAPPTPEIDFGSYELVLPSEPYIEGVSHIPTRPVPKHIISPPYLGKHENDPFAGDPYTGDGRIELNGKDEMNLRRASNIAKMVLNAAKTWAKVGVTTEEIDAKVHDLIISHGAYPSPLGYAGFPRSCCTSVNNVIVHGIPDNRPLDDGDIVNIDITVYIDGFHGDTSQTFLVGTVDALGAELVEATNAALKIGIDACGPNRPFSEIGHKIHEFALAKRYSVNDQCTGHGIGRVFHRPPWILHFKNDEPGKMLPGHVFTIEPALVQGDKARGWMFPDGWTIATESGARSAQAEHTVLITETGVEVLT
ncbi:methionyl aminopeptidase [Hysterangium stoloniferum]|nr:methionyl aminopeptidase [Hysterangium stoloniferum]